MRKSLSAIAAVVLLGSILASPVAAVSTQNYAGRPLQMDASISCQGLAYGTVAGARVLWMADHCSTGAGTVAKGYGNVRIGLWGSRTEGGASYDLTYIRLDAGYWPTNPQQVYRGGTSSPWWTITTKQPTSSLSRANLSSRFGTDVYQDWEQYDFTTTLFRTGTLVGYATFNGAATHQLATSIPKHTCSGCKDSGSSFVLSGFTNTVVGVATSVGSDQSVGINFSPFYDGWRAINTYYTSRGEAGAFLCTNASCT